MILSEKRSWFLIMVLCLSFGLAVMAGCTGDDEGMDCETHEDCSDGFECDPDELICVAEETEGCIDDDGCETGTCNTETGECEEDNTPVACTGETEDECGDGMYCDPDTSECTELVTCDDENPCEGELVCVDGACTEDEEDPCSVDNPCAEGEVCENGVCLDITCEEDTDCEEFVSIDVCEPTAGMCVECLGWDHCAYGEYCDNGETGATYTCQDAELDDCGSNSGDRSADDEWDELGPVAYLAEQVNVESGIANCEPGNAATFSVNFYDNEEDFEGLYTGSQQSVKYIDSNGVAKDVFNVNGITEGNGEAGVFEFLICFESSTETKSFKFFLLDSEGHPGNTSCLEYNRD